MVDFPVPLGLYVCCIRRVHLCYIPSNTPNDHVELWSWKELGIRVCEKVAQFNARYGPVAVPRIIVNCHRPSNLSQKDC